MTPVSWKSYRVGDLGALVGGATPSTGRTEYWDGDIPWTTSKALGEPIVLSHGERCITELGLAQSSATLVPAENVLVGTRVGVGKTVVTGVPIAINQDITGLLLDRSRFDPTFVAYALRTSDVQNEFARRARGTTIKGVPREELASLIISVPELAEQHRIAALLTNAQNCTSTQERAVRTARELKSTGMRQLFSSGLGCGPQVETAFGSLSAAWYAAPLGQCCDVQSGVTKGRRIEAHDAVEVPYLRVANVQDGHIDLSEVKTIEIRRSELARFLLRDGDVLLTEGGDLDKLGRGFIWRDQIPNCVHQNHVFAVRAHRDVLLPEFLAYLVQSPYGRAYFLAVAHKTTNLATINSTKLKAFPVPLPPLDEQREIVRVLETIDRKIALHERKRATLQELFDTLLHDLMTGRLRVRDLAPA